MRASSPPQQRPQLRSSPAAVAAWNKFEQCLEANGLQFEDVKDADAGARIEFIASIGGASLIFGGGGNYNNALAKPNEEVLADVAAAALSALPTLSGVEMALVSSRWNALVPTSASGASIPNGDVSRAGEGGEVGAGYGYGGGNRPVLHEDVRSSLPFLDPTHGRKMLHRPTVELLDELRRELSVGNSAPALAIASELLHRDPIPMMRVLNEFAPHINLAQMQDILGVKAERGNNSFQAPTEIGTSFSFSSPVGAAGGGRGIYGNNESGYRSAAGLPLTGSAILSSSASPQNSAAGLRRGVPTLNDIPLRVGAVLTEGALKTQFGAGFRATFSGSGRVVLLPHCVQEGDTIIVLKSSEIIA